MLRLRPATGEENLQFRPFVGSNPSTKGLCYFSRCYFDLSDADAKAMFEVVREELRPLLSLSFDDLDARIDEKTAQLAEKILENASAAELEPLRLGLGMTPQEFSEGIFCWKGFIYYKWRLNGLMANVAPVAAEILRVNTTDPMSFDQKGYIEGARDRLDKSIGQVCRIVKQTLNIYDAAYRDLTVNGNPLAFKEFLLKAPKMFNELGERLGAVDHILSFWRYRFPLGASAKVTTEELHELFVDFENSLSFKAVA